MSSSLQDAALRIGAQRTIPLPPRSKRPTTRWGSKRWTAGELHEHFARNPHANIAVRTGTINGARLAVVDVDGRDAAAALRSQGLLLPETYCVLSGGGPGRTHHYFSAPLDLPTFVIRYDAGRTLVEIKAKGALVVAPPSIHPDTGAAYVDDPTGAPWGTFEELPAWIIERAPRGAQAPGVRPTTGDSSYVPDDFDLYLRELLARDYVPTLTGRPIDHNGMVRCPFHAPKGGARGEEWEASLSVGGPRPEFWKCFGCERGGSIFDLAGYLLGVEPPLRGIAFVSVADHVARFYAKRLGIE